MRLRDCMIAQQSHTVLDRLGREAIGVHLALERKLASIGDPEVSWRMETADTGFFRAFSTQKRRDVMVIEHARLREYAVLISSRAHGSVLHVAWMLLITPHLANDLRRAVRVDVDRGARFQIGAELDVWDTADLQSFLGLTRLALKHAIRELTDGLDDDPGDGVSTEEME